MRGSLQASGRPIENRPQVTNLPYKTARGSNISINMRWLVSILTLLVVCTVLLFSTRERTAVSAAAFETTSEALPDGGEMNAVAIGHEFRQDDSPTIAAAPDGSLWVAWLSFDGSRDDVALRHYQNGKWG